MESCPSTSFGKYGNLAGNVAYEISRGDTQVWSNSLTALLKAVSDVRDAIRNELGIKQVS
jgi:hypothetical protein